jgi:hypothetical protein
MGRMRIVVHEYGQNEDCFRGVEAEWGLFLCPCCRLQPNCSVMPGPEIHFLFPHAFSLVGDKSFSPGSRPDTTQIVRGRTGNEF